MKPRSLLHPITERKSDICAALSSSVPDLRIIILFIEIYPRPGKESGQIRAKTRLFPSCIYASFLARAIFPGFCCSRKCISHVENFWSGCTTFTVEFRRRWGGRRRITAGDLRSPIAGETDLLASSSREKFRRDAILRSADREEECDWFGHRAFYYLER